MKLVAVVSGILLLAMPASAAGQSAAGLRISGNVSLVNDYRFRGFAQTGYKPAFQGGLEVEHVSGLFLGNWNSNVEQHLFDGAGLEMDFYGGYRGTARSAAYEIGAIYYSYPGSGGIDHAEAFASLSLSAVNVKYSHGVTAFFGLGEGTPLSSRHSGYVEVGAEIPVAAGWGIVSRAGHQHIRNAVSLGLPGSRYVDFEAGVTKEVNSWVLRASIVTTSSAHYFGTGGGEGGGRTRGILSVSTGF